ncbi:MAG: hypothetical protein ONB17_10470 [candidate division KSB1 bacterium]|nr:hypothetical protein [candidate division KSB1 bacterium]MDZ7386859.1 hypothetical protein [candidate division KSB1 bacterium]
MRAKAMWLVVFALLLVLDAGVWCKGARGDPIVVEMISAEWTGRFGILGIGHGIGPMSVIPWWYEIQVEWYTDHGDCPPTSLYRNGQVIAADVGAYQSERYYDWLSKEWECRGLYCYLDWVPAGSYCYVACWGSECAWNDACVTVP